MTPVAILKAADIAATADWYERAGFEVGSRDAEFCEVHRGGLTLQFIGGETPWPDAPGLTGSFYVHVPDLDAVADELRDKVGAGRDVEDDESGSRALVITDPDGYLITFAARAASACWCCGREFAGAELTRLGAHPEVSVCGDCARYLSRRATAPGVVRGGIDSAREWVVGRGWHERGRVGAVLRSIDRRLP